MAVDPTFSDPDVLMPGAYHEEPPLDEPPTSTTDMAASLTESTARPQRTQRVPARFQDILPEPP